MGSSRGSSRNLDRWVMSGLQFGSRVSHPSFELSELLLKHPENGRLRFVDATDGHAQDLGDFAGGSSITRRGLVGLPGLRFDAFRTAWAAASRSSRSNSRSIRETRSTRASWLDSRLRFSLPPAATLPCVSPPRVVEGVAGDLSQEAAEAPVRIVTESGQLHGKIREHGLGDVFRIRVLCSPCAHQRMMHGP